MRCLEKNKQDLYYALYIKRTELKDNNGLNTGEWIVEHSTPKKARMNISAARGTADVEEFGINNPYTHILVTDDMQTKFDTATIFWIGITPDNDTPHNFVVTQVARSLNHVSIAVREINTNVENN